MGVRREQSRRKLNVRIRTAPETEVGVLALASEEPAMCVWPTGLGDVGEMGVKKRELGAVNREQDG